MHILPSTACRPNCRLLSNPSNADPLRVSAIARVTGQTDPALLMHPSDDLHARSALLQAKLIAKYYVTIDVKAASNPPPRPCPTAGIRRSAPALCKLWRPTVRYGFSPLSGSLDCPAPVVLPHVILLPAASSRMLPAARREGSEATYGGRPLTSPISRNSIGSLPQHNQGTPSRLIIKRRALTGPPALRLWRGVQDTNCGFFVIPRRRHELRQDSVLVLICSDRIAPPDRIGEFHAHGMRHLRPHDAPLVIRASWPYARSRVTF